MAEPEPVLVQVKQGKVYPYRVAVFGEKRYVEEFLRDNRYEYEGIAPSPVNDTYCWGCTMTLAGSTIRANAWGWAVSTEMAPKIEPWGDEELSP